MPEFLAGVLVGYITGIIVMGIVSLSNDKPKEGADADARLD